MRLPTQVDMLMDGSWEWPGERDSILRGLENEWRIYVNSLFAQADEMREQRELRERLTLVYTFPEEG